MPRQKLPSSQEKARFVRKWTGRFRLSTPDPADPALLKAAFQGWAAVQWVEEHGQLVDADTLAAVLEGAKVRAGNSSDKRLWRERILYVAPLNAHYRLPAKVWQWVLRAGVQAGHFPAVAAPEALQTPDDLAPLQPYLITLASKPSVLIDRATRGPEGWNNTTLQYHEVFEDWLVLNYFDENIGADTLRQQLMTLDPRTSDVWRRLTARALKYHQENRIMRCDVLACSSVCSDPSDWDMVFTGRQGMCRATPDTFGVLG